jgi:NCAIR mutase (PurE)-related protein
MLRKIQAGTMSPEDALSKMCTEPFQDLGYAKPDHHRELRQGIAEVVYGAGKTPEQIVGIVNAMRGRGQELVLITRLSQFAAEAVAREVPIQYYDTARIGVAGSIPMPNGIGRIVVAAAGTSDMPVAEEAAVTAEAFGNEVVRMYDVGVAGLHRLLAKLDVLHDARAVISIAGMEGALTSVIGGLVDCPVIGVPTSVGYGASFNGISALLTMLNSCASGVSVVNIDNGFGAGYLASMINHMR